MAEQAKELGRLFPGEVYTTQGGEEIAIRPITFGQLKVFVDAISSLVTKAAQAGIDNIEDPSEWPRLFEVAYDEIAKLMVAILNEPEYNLEWLKQLPASDAIGIFTIIVKQNANEVTKKNIQGLAKAIQSITPTSPSSSSPEDTGGTTSSE